METRASPRGLSLVWAVLWPGELSAALTETSTSEHLNTGGRDRRTNGAELCTGEDLRPTQGRGRGCAELGAMSHNTVRADGRGTQERDAGPRGEGPQSSRLCPGTLLPQEGPWVAGTELLLENAHRSKLNSKVSSKHVITITEQYFCNQ